jgi:hypothetical protein
LRAIKGTDADLSAHCSSRVANFQNTAHFFAMFPLPDSEFSRFTFKVVLALVTGLLMAGLL